MDRDVIATGKTIDEAIENGCAKLGVSGDNVTYEVIELPKKKFFGLKTVPAKVKVTLTEEYAAKFCAKEEKKAPKKECKAPKAEAPKAEQPKKEKKPQPKKQEQKPQAPKAEQKLAEQNEKVCECREPSEKPVKEIPQEVLDRKGGDAARYTKEVLDALGYTEAEVSYSQKDGMIVLQLSGEELGGVVGKRGDNLDAMQYLASLVANRSEGGYVRVVLDVDDYRSKREASLRAYARKMAFQAVKGQRNITLEAMNPYERRIVHSSVQTVNGATSKSIGMEPNRRVVISPVDGAKPQRGDRRHSDQGRRHGHIQRGEAQKSYVPTVPTANEIPKNDTSAISLYGRIDLG